MIEVDLADVATIRGGGRLKISGKDFVPSGFPAFGAGGMNGLVPVAEYDRDAVVLSSVGARCGKCFHARGQWTSLANTIVVLPDSDSVDCRFLWYQLNDESRWPRSGTGQPFIKPSDVKSHRVWIPDLGRQRQIAAVLDAADALLSMRRESIRLLDQLADSRFEALFGRSDSAWPVTSLGELIAETQLGLVRGAKELGPELTHEYVRMDAIGRDGLLDLRALTRTSASEAELAKYSVEYGDLLFNTRNTRELVGKSAIYRDASPRLFNNNLMRIRFSPGVLADYVLGFLRSSEGRNQLESRKSGTTSVFAIYSRQLMSIRIALPPVSLQERYAGEAAALAALRTDMIASAEDMAGLFESLRKQAFAFGSFRVEDDGPGE